MLLQSINIIMYTLIVVLITLYIFSYYYPQINPCPQCPPCKIVKNIIKPTIQRKSENKIYRSNSSLKCVKWDDEPVSNQIKFIY